MATLNVVIIVGLVVVIAESLLMLFWGLEKQ